MTPWSRLDGALTDISHEAANAAYKVLEKHLPNVRDWRLDQAAWHRFCDKVGEAVYDQIYVGLKRR